MVKNLSKKEKIRMLWTMVGAIQADAKESFSKDQMEFITSMEEDFKDG